MTKSTGTTPNFHAHDVVAPHCAGWPYTDMVDELRRDACRHFEEDEQAGMDAPLITPIDEG